MTESDWIILRLTKEIDESVGFNGPDCNAVKAILYLIKKYGRRKINKSIKRLEKEKQAKVDKFDELLKDYLKALKNDS
jgi:hypothetical protein